MNNHSIKTKLTTIVKQFSTDMELVELLQTGNRDSPGHGGTDAGKRPDP